MEKIDFCKAEKVKGEENQMEEKNIIEDISNLDYNEDKNRFRASIYG